MSQLIHGELDWIAMKALEKQRTRRYETANALAADVLRYLHDEAVQACPPSNAYRFRKFAKRNTAGLVMAAVVLAALMLATIGLAISNVFVRSERNEKVRCLVRRKKRWARNRPRCLPPGGASVMQRRSCFSPY